MKIKKKKIERNKIRDTKPDRRSRMHVMCEKIIKTKNVFFNFSTVFYIAAFERLLSFRYIIIFIIVIKD